MFSELHESYFYTLIHIPKSEIRNLIFILKPQILLYEENPYYNQQYGTVDAIKKSIYPEQKTVHLI